MPMHSFEIGADSIDQRIVVIEEDGSLSVSEKVDELFKNRYSLVAETRTPLPEAFSTHKYELAQVYGFKHPEFLETSKPESYKFSDMVHLFHLFNVEATCLNHNSPNGAIYEVKANLMSVRIELRLYYSGQVADVWERELRGLYAVNPICDPDAAKRGEYVLLTANLVKGPVVKHVILDYGEHLNIVAACSEKIEAGAGTAEL